MYESSTTKDTISGGNNVIFALYVGFRYNKFIKYGEIH